jgi:hypothetical protein
VKKHRSKKRFVLNMRLIPPRQGGGAASRLRSALLFLLLLALAAPASAQATWSAPLTLSATGQSAYQPQVGLDQSGNAVFTWSRPDSTTDCNGGPCTRIQARARSTDGTLSAVQTLSERGQNAAVDPEVAVDQSGDAVFVWRRRDGTTDCNGYPGCLRAQTRTRFASGALSPIQTVSPPGQHSYEPHVGVDQSGNAVFVWRGWDPATCGTCFHILARARSVAGTLSATETLSGGVATAPQVAVDQSGDAVFAWMGYDGTTDCGAFGCYRVQTRFRSAAGTLTSLQNISPAGKKGANSPQLGVDQSGNAVFAWRRPDATTDCSGSGCQLVQTRARAAAGTLSAVQTLSSPGQNAAYPDLAVDQGGDAVFAWRRPDATTDCFGSGCQRVQTRARTASGLLSTIQNLSQAGEPTDYPPHVGIDQSANAVFVWLSIDGTTDCGGNYCVRARARSAAGVLSAIQTVSATGQDASVPQVAVDPGGSAIAVWERFDGTYVRVQAAVGP